VFHQTLLQQYFDETVGLARNDVGADSLIPGATGPEIVITDPGHNVTYFIRPEARNCTVATLEVPYGGGGIVIDPDGTYHFGKLNQLFYLVNASEYTYVGNSSAHGVVLDNWMYMGDLDLPYVSYRDATMEISIARNGAPSTRGTNTEPIPWKISLEGTIVVGEGTFNTTLSSVTRLFDLSFEEPSLDVFDVSLCSEPKDYVVMVMSVPKGPNNMVDYSTFRKNVRQSIVDYTQVAPLQVGNIEVGLGSLRGEWDIAKVRGRLLCQVSLVE